jgi:ribonuclease-3
MNRCWPDPEKVQRPAQDSKGALQELLQRGGGAPPEYRITGQSGPAHAPVFEATVYRQGQPIAAGRGHTKKQAEQEAAVQALRILSKE